ncbi:hypothetical protein OCGS_2068 [Oceaniovalibus guishaninsula JLT2003]|uniref:Uncharacterized protein n=1 Tax=Oceaniovalibus guishaninsula JLT2003 TaxID=1231392 RepID=K2HLH2_9RHOB|nr:hypothetical protein OCGS_2068 [Oceaniovalibus guishaninsula JLT2003]
MPDRTLGRSAAHAYAVRAGRMVARRPRSINPLRSVTGAAGTMR